MTDEELIDGLRREAERFEPRPDVETDPRETGWREEAVRCAARLRDAPTDEDRELAAHLLSRAREGFRPPGG